MPPRGLSFNCFASLNSAFIGVQIDIASIPSSYGLHEHTLLLPTLYVSDDVDPRTHIHFAVSQRFKDMLNVDVRDDGRIGSGIVVLKAKRRSFDAVLVDAVAQSAAFQSAQQVHHTSPRSGL